MEWTHTFEAVVEAAREQNATEWKLGDAMLVEIGAPDGSKEARARLRACLRAIREHAADRSMTKTARQVYAAAAAFPPEHRRPDLSNCEEH